MEKTTSMKYQIVHKEITQGNSDLTPIDHNKIDQIQDKSIAYIDMHNILELIDSSNYLITIQSKLKPGGSASIVGLDLNRLCEFYLDKYIDTKEFNTLVKGKTLFTLKEVTDLLKKYFTIKTVKTDKLLYFVEFGM